jgi:hypothetical protein
MGVRDILANTYLDRTSKEYVHVPVFGTDDPSTYPVEMSFPLETDRPSDWLAAEWIEIAGVLNVRVLVGPGSPNVLPAGRYSVYWRFTGPTETPVKQATNRLVIT